MRGRSSSKRIVKAAPVGANVSRISYWKCKHIGSVAKVSNDLVCGGGLPCNAVRIDRIHDLHAAAPSAKLTDDLQRVVKVATDRDHLCPCGKGLQQLPCGDLPCWKQHNRLNPRGGGVCGGGCRGVASAGADHGASARLQSLRHRHHHAAILE